MWIPSLLEGMNAKEMKSLGMKMSVSDIYNVNKSSLKDAVPHFNGGCIAEVISGRGLLLTNHHCGYGQIQAHSTLENDYLTNGFWAKSLSEELPNKNLEVTFIVRIEDVTAKVQDKSNGGTLWQHLRICSKPYHKRYGSTWTRGKVGYKDASAWARGQAWGIYGTAIAYKNTGDKEYIKYFERVSKYFLKHLPKDLCPYWDLSFGDGDENEQPRDSSSAAIAVCGFLEMSKYLDEESRAYYTSVAKKIMYSLINNYQVKDKSISNGQLLHGTYAKKTPYNTCKNSGVDECVIWGDYFFMEALTRVSRPDWKMYW